MNKVFGCFVVFVLALAGCGGGSPYVGLWQCVTDPARSLEIKRFEDYFIITARDGERQLRREGVFENELFTVGANNVGQAMALELVGEEITCTNPPNFCHCDSPYKKVESLVHADKSEPSREEKGAVEPIVVEPDPPSTEQIILDREPIILKLSNGGTLRLFHHAANEENEKRSIDWIKLKFYYLPHVTLEKLASGKVADVRQNGDDVDVFFRITASKIDWFEFMENIHKWATNTQIRRELVLPLSYEHITVEIPGSSLLTPAVVPASEFDLKSGSLDISLPVLSEPADDVAAKLKKGNEIATAINNSSALPVAFIDVMQMGSAGNANAGDRQQVTKKWPIAGHSKNP